MPTLYSYKVRLLAAFLQVHLDIIEIDILSDEQHGSNFLSINPKGEVPALVDDSVVLTDSAAILVYLAGEHAKQHGRGWWPSDVTEQAHITEWLAFAASWVQYGVFTPDRWVERPPLSEGGDWIGGLPGCLILAPLMSMDCSWESALIPCI